MQVRLRRLFPRAKVNHVQKENSVAKKYIHDHCADMSKTRLSPNAAAKITGASRSSIMRALMNKSLFAVRDNQNRWIIERSDLDKWLGDRRDTLADVRPVTETVPDMSGELSKYKVSLAAAQAENLGLRDRLADTQADRDAWRAQAEELISKGRRPISIWAWLTGR